MLKLIQAVATVSCLLLQEDEVIGSDKGSCLLFCTWPYYGSLGFSKTALLQFEPVCANTHTIARFDFALPQAYCLVATDLLMQRYGENECRS